MESVANTVKKLMITEPFYGIFASGLQRSWSTQVDIMGIVPDGLNYKLLINKNYWESLDKKHQMGLLKHNLLHMCFFHVTDFHNFEGFSNNKNIIYMAMDLEVFSYIDDDYIMEDEPALKIFKLLPNLRKGLGTKEYIKILNAVKDGTLKDLFPEINLQYGTDTQGVLEQLERGDRDHNTWTNIRGHNITLMRDQLEYRMRTAVEGSKSKIPQELKNIIDGLFTFKKPIFNWKKFFRNFIANAIDFLPKSTRRKESNRFAGALGHKLSKKHTILVGVDTSGSIGQKELDEFFSEIYHVWKAGANVDIVEFDWVIQAQYKYKGKTPAEVKGRGGTSFKEFVDYYNSNCKKYTVALCFTDGYANLNVNPVGKFCWIITSNGNQGDKYPGYKICIPKIIE